MAKKAVSKKKATKTRLAASAFSILRPRTQGRSKGKLSKAALLNVIQQTRDNSTYANVASIMRLPKGMSAPTPRDYVRVCDRTPSEAEAVPPEYGDGGPAITDDDVPF